MLAITQKPATMPTYPEPGEILLYLDLDKIENPSAADALVIAKGLGFSPQLRTKAWIDEEGLPQAAIFAVLYSEQRDPASTLEAHHAIDDKVDALSSIIQPAIAVRFAYNLKGGRATE